MAYEHVADSQRRKWDPKAKKRILVGYDSESNHYRLIDILRLKLRRLQRQLMLYSMRMMKYHGKIMTSGQ